MATIRAILRESHIAARKREGGVAEQYANRASTTLDGAIDGSATSISVASATGFPTSAQYRIVIDNEILLVTGGVGTTTWAVSRGAEGTASVPHTDETAVIHVLTAASLRDVPDYTRKDELTTKGDLYVATGAGSPQRLGVGANAQMLMADSTQAAGVKWSLAALDGLSDVDVESPVAGDLLTWIAGESKWKNARPAQVTVRVPRSWSISGEVGIPTGDQGFICPFFVKAPTGQTVQLVSARYQINSGTSVVCKLQRNGADITGFTGITVTTTPADTDPPDVALNDNDAVALVVTAVSGTPKNMSFTVFLDLSVSPP